MWDNSQTFWAARDAWVTASAAKTRGRRADFSLEKKSARWALKASSYLRGSPAVAKAVAFDQEQVRAALTAHIERAGPELAAAFDANLPWVAASAFAAWPVRSGYSKSSIILYYREDDTAAFVGGIAVLAPYAAFIKGSPATKLIRGPVSRLVKPIVAEFFRRMGA